MNQRGAAQIFIGLLVVIITLTGLIYLKTNNKAGLSSTPQIIQGLSAQITGPNQKTYTDQSLKFNFTYPSDGYNLMIDNEDKYFARHGGDLRKNFQGTWGYPTPMLIEGLILQNTADLNQDIDLSPFTVWVFDNPDNLDGANWYKNYWYYPFVWGEYEPQKGQDGPDQIASVSGQSVSYKIITYQPIQPKFVYLSSNGKMYLFRIINQNSNNIGDTTLNSFKLSL